MTRTNEKINENFIFCTLQEIQESCSGQTIVFPISLTADHKFLRLRVVAQVFSVSYLMSEWGKTQVMDRLLEGSRMFVHQHVLLTIKKVKIQFLSRKI